MKVIELLTKMANEEEVPKKIKYKNKIYEWKEYEAYYGKIMTKKSWVKEYGYVAEENRTYFYLKHCYQDLNDEVEIIEEPKEHKIPEIENFRAFKKFVEENKKELHANNIEFKINNDKRDCIITLDENDLGIDKLHLDNCCFYKENDKWYVKKYNFKTIELEEHKIPEKLDLGDYTEITSKNDMEYKMFEYIFNKNANAFYNKINEIIDYLEEIE